MLTDEQWAELELLAVRRHTMRKLLNGRRIGAVLFYVYLRDEANAEIAYNEKLRQLLGEVKVVEYGE
jgi:hypothetical protein